MNFSIKTTLIALFSVSAAILAAISITSLISAYDRNQSADDAVNYVLADQALFGASSAYRIERADAGSVLLLAGDKAQPVVAKMMERRAIVDRGLGEAIVELNDLGQPAANAVAASLRTVASAIQRQRSDVDAALQLPVGARDAKLGDRVIAESVSILSQFDQATTEVEREIRSLAPSLLRFIVLRAASGNARVAAGEGSRIISAALRTKTPFSPANSLAVAVQNAKTQAAWSEVQSLADGGDIPATLKAAIASAEQIYFAGEAAALRQRLTDELSAGTVPDIDTELWRAKSIAALEKLAGVSLAVMDSLAAEADSISSHAWYLLLSYAALLALTLAVGLVGLLVVIYRVARPISHLTLAMEDLAGGRLSIEIPNTHRRDEIGGMAKALLVFKDEMARNAALEAEAGVARQRAEAERRESMTALAGAFENVVGGIIGGVAAAAGQLHGTARAMTQAARRTSEQSTAVAAAAEQASANVVMVASSAEELGSSVDEIGRQVQQSAQMSHVAVAEAEKTGKVMQDLAQAAARIGDVVGLISSIAGQTNLLALNATIEAAPRRRCRQGLRGGRLRSQGARYPDGQGDRGDREPDQRHPVQHPACGSGHRDRGHPDPQHERRRLQHLRRGGGAGGGDPRDRPQRRSGRHRNPYGERAHRQGGPDRRRDRRFRRPCAFRRRRPVRPGGAARSRDAALPADYPQRVRAGGWRSGGGAGRGPRRTGWPRLPCLPHLQALAAGLLAAVLPAQARAPLL